MLTFCRSQRIDEPWPVHVDSNELKEQRQTDIVLQVLYLSYGLKFSGSLELLYVIPTNSL